MEIAYKEFNSWKNLNIITKDLGPDDHLVVVLSRKNKPSYQISMERIPAFLTRYYRKKGFMLVYPAQEGVWDTSKIDFRNASLLGPVDKLDEIVQSVLKTLKGTSP